MVLAPVAEKVVARSTTPVVVVPRPRGGTAEERPVTALLGLGFPEDDEPVAAWAADAARRTDAPLTVVQTRGGAQVEDWAARFDDVDATVRDLRGASPGDLLLAVGPAPLIVFSVGHGSFLHRSLDGPHRFLLRHCTSPMALIPAARRAEPEQREGIADTTR
jgi:hypothetical protein